MKKVSIITLGCPKNTADTDALARVLAAKGHQMVSDAAEADTIVVHTCSFIEAAKKESINTILQVGQLKTAGKKLIVTGCLVQQHGDEIFKEIPEVDAFLGTGQLSQVADLLEKPRERFIDRANPGGFMDPDLDAARQKVRPLALRADAPVLPPTSHFSHPTLEVGSRKLDDVRSPSAVLRLSEGCSHPCSFCVIPRLRGPVQSRTADTILQEARDLAARGVEEFSLIAQDTGDWGRDFSTPSNLPGLLRSLAETSGLRWIRVMYMHPASMTEDLLNVFAEYPDKFTYLDMPLQHIDTEMLAQMKRKTDESGLRHLLDRIKLRAPQMSLRTTFIVGAPGETPGQFKRLINFVKEGHFDYLGAFAYSKEEGTPAAKRADQIADEVKDDRLAELTNAYYDVADSKAQKRLGQTEVILLEESEGDSILGRTRREAPEIDAVVRLAQSAARKGNFITAKLTAYEAYEFTAQLVL